MNVRHRTRGGEKRGPLATAGSGLGKAARAGSRALRDRPGLMALVGLLAVALGLRIALSLAYQPATLSQFDANVYVWQAQGSLFASALQAPGYSAFLRLAHVLSDQVAVAISLQHLLGLTTAVLAWWTVRRISGSDWLGLIPAAVVLLNGDTLLLEHSVMSETLFTFLVVATIAAAVGALQAARPWTWLALAGTLLGAAIWVRYAAVGLVPVLVVWALLVFRPIRRDGIAAGAAALVPVIVLVGLLVVLQGRQTGFYGLGESGGWALYSRVAGFADCTRFDPPAGTEQLCESTPPETRQNPDWYGASPDSPAVRLFESAPNGDAELRSWAQSAIVAQPLDYAGEVLDDLALYVDEQPWTNRDVSLIGSRVVSFTLRSPDEHCGPSVCRAPPLGIEGNSVFAWTSPDAGAYYAAFEPRAGAAVVLFQDLQRVLRVHGVLLGLAIALSLLGLLAVRGRLAKAQWLLTLSALALLVVPVATTTYNIRYALPALPLFAAAAVLAPVSLREGAGWIPRAWRRLREHDWRLLRPTDD
jgi:Dolichyl-phosphate-mannose-protein mannosyltransferase